MTATQTITCDNCGDPQVAGAWGHPPDDWYVLKAGPGNPHERTDKHYCSINCLSRWAINLRDEADANVLVVKCDHTNTLYWFAEDECWRCARCGWWPVEVPGA